MPQVGFGWTNGVALVLLNSTYVICDILDDSNGGAKSFVESRLFLGMAISLGVASVGLAAYLLYAYAYERETCCSAMAKNRNEGSMSTNLL